VFYLVEALLFHYSFKWVAYLVIKLDLFYARYSSINLCNITYDSIDTEFVWRFSQHASQYNTGVSTTGIIGWVP